MLNRVSSIDRPRYSELAALATFALLGLVALWLLARIVWLSIPRGDAVPGMPAAHVGGAGVVGSGSAASIAKWHLFGNTPYSRSAGPDAPGTTLPLILRGTLADPDPRAGIAVIDSGQEAEQAYRVGQEIAAGVTLAEVHPDHVVLLHDGAEEVLNLPREENLAPGDVVRPTPGHATGGASAASARGAAVPPAGEPRRNPDAAGRPRTIGTLRVTPDALVDRVKLVPVLDDGRVTGVRLAADAALLSKAGLRPSDVITAVNGVAVDSVARGRQIVDSLRTATSARVNILRDGKPTEVDVDLSQGPLR
ncbi:MAG TPA: type II secretion system protein N [Rhodanobacteraceae bacterium]|nr:type II secretion system protein N [Rhodanobacteraceae bacterium]